MRTKNEGLCLEMSKLPELESQYLVLEVVLEFQESKIQKYIHDLKYM